MLDLNDLASFLKIIDTGSISRAAQELGLTQPALSLKLKKLESELGVQLFQRTPRNVVPLESALSIEAKIRDILSEFDGVKELLSTSLATLKGRVAIGALTGWMNSLVIPTVQKLNSHAPELRVRVVVAAETVGLLPLLMNGRLDLAIVAQPFERLDGLEFEHLLDERLVLIGHNLPKSGSKAERKRELLQRPWITLRMPDPLVEAYWNEHFDEQTFPWNQVYVPVACDHIDAIPPLVERLPGAVAVVPSQIVPPGHPSYEIAEAIPSTNGLFLAWRRESLALKRFRLTKDLLVDAATKLRGEI